MLTIKRHFPINKLMITRALYSVYDYVWHIGHDTIKRFKELTRGREHLGRKSLVSTLVLLVGFFGSLAAFIGLRPIMSQGVGSPTAKVESTEAPATTPATQTQTASNEQQSTQPAATTQPAQSAQPAPAASPSTSSTPVIGSTPVPRTAPVISSTPTVQPGMGSSAPAPVPVVTSPTPPSTPPPSSAPISSTVNDLQNTVTSPNLLAPVTSTVEDTAGKLLGQ
jgi:hypothetical protein